MQALNRRTAPNLPHDTERILQFGKGNFLRAFAECAVQRQSNELDFQSSIVIAEATPRGGGETINEQDGLYHITSKASKTERSPATSSRANFSAFSQ